MVRQQMGAMSAGAPGQDMQKAFEAERAALELVCSTKTSNPYALEPKM